MGNSLNINMGGRVVVVNVKTEEIIDDGGREVTRREREIVRAEVAEALGKKKKGFGAIVGKGQYFGILADRSRQ